MKNVLFLLDYYCENASANGICCKNVAREMVQRGYNVSVGSYRPAAAPKVEKIDGVQVYKTWTMPSVKHHRTQKERFRFYGKWLWPFQQYPAAEDSSRTESIYSAAMRIILEQNIDTVICVHLPVETLIAGVALKAEFPEIHFCSYMLDSMSGGMLPRFLPHRYAKLCKIKWEDRILSKMDLSVLMESSKAHHERFTANKKWMHRAVYSDIPQIAEFSDVGSVYNGEQNVRMAYVGTLADGVRTPYHFLRVLEHVTAFHIDLTIAGNNYCKQDLSRIVAGNKQIKLQCIGALSHDLALDLMKNAHVLVNFGNSNSSLVPSKIFEYMSYGKPILSTAPIKDEPCIKYLERYPLAAIIYQQEEIFDQNIEQVEQFILSHRRSRFNSQQLLEVFASNTPQALYKSICNEDDK